MMSIKGDNKLMVTVTRQQKGNRRYYTVEDDESVAGLELPSVTTLTNVLDKPALVGWAERIGIEGCQQFAKDYNFETTPHGLDWEEWVDYMGATVKGITHRTRDAAADKGTAIHEYIDDILHGGMPHPVPSEYQQAISNFVRWYTSSGITNIQFSELPVYSSTYKYGGTIDAIGQNHTGAVLLDWKTSNGLYPEVALQLAGYCQAYAEMNNCNPHAIKLLAVRLGKDRPDFEVKEVANFDVSFKGFLAAKGIYEWKQSKPLV